MPDRPDEFDRMIDETADSISRQRLDEVTERQIRNRVWDMVSDGLDGQQPLTGCADFQAEIPAYVAGELSEARALLIADHTRECLACRRELMNARGAASETAGPQPRRPRSLVARPLLRVAAALALFAGTYGLWVAVGNSMADRRLTATIESIDGTLQHVDEVAVELEPGLSITSRQAVRTARDSGAMLRLADGTLIELDQRSELSVRAGRRGTTIDLARGNIIVHAAEQHGGRLFVDTADCEVAVKGTIFAVDHGLKGSRVSVIEGEVEVREGPSNALLLPGDQITTGRRLRPVPVEEQVSWSRDAAKHKALVRELTNLRRVMANVVDNAAPRTSTALLDLAPPQTVVYLAMPNITEDLDEARSLFAERIAASQVLAQWWQEVVVDPGYEQQIDQILDRLEPIGEAIGEEAVIAIPFESIADEGIPVFIAELDDAETFRALLEDLIADSDNPGDVALIEDPWAENPQGAELLLWVHDSLFAAAHDIDVLRALNTRVDDPAAREFVGTRLHTRLADLYAGGVSWLAGVDLQTIVDAGIAELSEGEAQSLAGLGLTSADTFVVERHRDGDWYATDAEIQFTENRTGIVAWLAEPAPMGSLEFVSPDAYVAASAVTSDAVEMFDELLAFIASQNDSVFADLANFEQRFGIDLRDDLAASFGGEGTLALDGPMLPVPSWKFIVEVYDAATLVHTIEVAVDEINAELEANGHSERVVLEVNESGGQTYYLLRRTGSMYTASFTFVDGFMVMGPHRALLDQAIALRDSGVTLPASEAFQALLPDNGYTDCSALFYRDLGSLLDAVPDEMMGELEMLEAASDDLSMGLVCVFGEPDRITASATGGSLLGLGAILGMHGATLHDEPIEEIRAIEVDTEV
jgi:ferric-dicitrate binding protein FerR (iron transport regulator)